VREAACRLKKEGVALPFVWNSSGYERVETLEEYSELCDWALFDLRYSRNETASSLSQTSGYVEAARAAVRWAWEKRGEGGVVVRILVLPGHSEEAIENLAWIATELSNEVPVSVMAQYTPAYKALETPPLDRSVTREEYESVTEAAADFGFEHGWIQGFAASDPALALLGENMSCGHGIVV
jgi:putative pyruvate formate lyase activating enzyme